MSKFYDALFHYNYQGYGYHSRHHFEIWLYSFSARVREAYLLHGPAGLSKDMIVNQLIEEFLPDFDIFHLADPGELVHHVEAKYIPNELG